MTFQEIKQIKEQINWDIMPKKSFKRTQVSSFDHLDTPDKDWMNGYFFYISVRNNTPRLTFIQVQNGQFETLGIISFNKEILEQAVSEAGGAVQLNGIYPMNVTVKNILKGELSV